MIIVRMSEVLFEAPAIRAVPADQSHGCARLADWGVIRALGPDAASFLQGQLTSDIAGLAPGAATLAGYCSPKGRLLASFIVWSPAAEEFLLACSAEILPATLKRLSMFVLRAKCKLTDASGELALWGVAGPDAGLAEAREGSAWTVQPAGAGQAIRLPDAVGVPRWLLAQPADAAAPALPALDPAAWRWLEVASGVVRIVAATLDQFVPQMVNLELVGGVNFKKGCYPGQEVVARSQYRGTLKRRAFLLGAQAAAQPGQEVFHEADGANPAGMVVNAASFDGRHVLLAELKLAVLDHGTLRLGAPDGPLLERLPMPYEVPVDASSAAA
jgi:folate-binding protein YgfZ